MYNLEAIKTENNIIARLYKENNTRRREEIII